MDDEAAIRSALERWFRMKGFEVTCAADGAEAVAHCASGAFDVVTMDLGMPRMGGLEAIPAIRSLHPGLPIIVLTGYAKDEQTARDSGVVDVLLKPLRLPELEARVLRALGVA